MIILTPTVPPDTCGVSDYGYRLASTLLAANTYKNVQIGVKNKNVLKKYTGKIIVGEYKNALKKVRQSAEECDLILNFTPTGYSYYGFSSKLIFELRRFVSSSNNRVFIIFHETYNGSRNIRLHHKVRDWFTKYSIKSIMKISAGASVATVEQKEKLTNLIGHTNINILPISANILPGDNLKVLQNNRQKAQWVIFGLAHTRLWSIQYHLDFIKALKGAGVVKQIISIGPVGNKYAKQEAALVASTIGPNFLIQTGELDNTLVSEKLMNAEAALLNQNSKSLLKSGTFMALAAHGTPIICDVPYELEDPPGWAIFRPAEVLNNPIIFDTEESQTRKRELYDWFWSTHSWTAVADNILMWLSK